MEKGPLTRRGRIGKVTLIPDNSLVVEETLSLRIPVSRHSKTWRLCKVIFNQPAILLRLSIHEIAIFLDHLMKIVNSAAIRVDDDAPVSVQCERCTVIDIDEKSRPAFRVQYSKDSSHKDNGKQVARGSKDHEVTPHRSKLRKFLDFKEKGAPIVTLEH